MLQKHLNQIEFIPAFTFPWSGILLILSSIHYDFLFFSAHSEPLRQLLKNTHLRKLLKMIDDSPDPESIMHMAMQEPLFLEYVTVCMEETNMGWGS